jgi:FtsH-binding integral membrane protein
MDNGTAITTTPPSIVWQRRDFLLKTYGHLLGAVLAFVVLEMAYFASGLAETIAGALLSVPWLLVLGGFIVVGFVGRSFAASRSSRRMQYVGFGGYVLAESVIFVPLLWVANAVAPGSIRAGASLTILAFVALTAIAFSGGADFTLLGGLLKWAGAVALVAIVGALLFGFALGTWFVIGMIALAGVAILYDTSRALTQFPDDAYVGAALELFASVALMFWYAVSLFSRR